MLATEIHPTDRKLFRYCTQFDLHIDWLKNGWYNQNSLFQSVWEDADRRDAERLKAMHGYGDMEISIDSDTDWSYACGEAIVLSLDKTKYVDNLIINTLSFYQGELLAMSDRGLPDYHFEPFHVMANNKTQLRAEIKHYSQYLHKKYSGDYGKIYVKYY